ncbi:DUF1027 domain-containing protein, partial [Mammaliicoccus sciuri]
EYCNFGCKYFVLRRLSKSEISKLTAEEATFIDEEHKLEDVKIEPTIQQNTKQEQQNKQQEAETVEIEEDVIEEQPTSKNTLKDYL